MTQPLDRDAHRPLEAGLPAPLADYADRLLLGTGLEAADAVLIARGQLELPAELGGLAKALQAGWMAEADPA
jgi:hypothetical protein